MSGDYTHKVVAYEERAKQGETSHLHAVLSALKPSNSVLVVVGLERWFDRAGSMEVLEENEFTISGFGSRILRAETAPLYALSAISYQTELIEVTIMSTVAFHTLDCKSKSL